MELVYIANEISNDTMGVLNQIRSRYPSIKLISDDKGTNYDSYVNSKDDSTRYFVIVNCISNAPYTESFKDLCALGAAGMLHRAKYVLFYYPETSIESLLHNIYECIEETVPEA